MKEELAEDEMYLDGGESIKEKLNVFLRSNGGTGGGQGLPGRSFCS
jgi:hypothetical protein